MFLVYGKLNIDGFYPYETHANGSLKRWLIPECKDAEFYGMEHIEGEANHDYHVVAVQNGILHCQNLTRLEGGHFGIEAKTVLPLTIAHVG